MSVGQKGGDKMEDLEMFLREKAKELHPMRTTMEYEVYKEDVEPNYQRFIEKDCSWLHKVGVLALIDGNKFDFCTLFIGVTDAHDECQFIGKLDFSQGENMDLARLLTRMVRTIKETADIFEE